MQRLLSIAEDQFEHPQHTWRAVNNRAAGEPPLPSYGSVDSVNHPVRICLPGGLGAVGKIPGYPIGRPIKTISVLALVRVTLDQIIQKRCDLDPATRALECTRRFRDHGCIDRTEPDPAPFQLRYAMRGCLLISCYYL